MLVVQALARVLLQMQARDADLARFPLGQVERDGALADNRPAVLRDLIPRRQIGIEVIFAVEYRDQVYLGVEPEPGLHRLLDAEVIDDWEHARHRRIDEGDLRIRLRAKIGRRAGEQLGVADDLGMDFKPEHDLPVSRAPFHEAHERPPSARTEGTAVKSAARSMARATFSTVSSSKARPITCRP